MVKVKIKKGDIVRVISGSNKTTAQKTVEGKVLSVDRVKNRVVVEGVNLVSKHTKPNAKNPDGGIVKQEASIHISNVVLIDSSGNPTKVGRRLNKEGKLERYSKKTGEVIK